MQIVTDKIPGLISSHSTSPKFRKHRNYHQPTASSVGDLSRLKLVLYVHYISFIDLVKYPYRSWNSSLIDQHFTHAMDLLKYKEKQIFCGHSILTNCVGYGNWRWFRSRQWQNKIFNILLLFCHWVISTIFAAGLPQSRFSYSSRSQERAVNGIAR